jgi:hypothetical protein
VDAQTLRTRRTVAIVGAIILAILFLLLLRGCLGAREERGLKDYVRDVRAIVDQSGSQSEEMFNTLSEPGRGVSDVDRENSLKGLRAQAEQLVDRARNDLDAPDDLKAANDYLIETLEFRRDGIGKVVDVLPTALSGDEREQGAQRLADQMGFFLTSDVVFAARARPNMDSVLREKEIINEVQLPESRFLPDRAWLIPDEVTKLLKGGGGGGNSDRSDEEASPGLHGTGLGTVSLGGQQLSEGGSANVKLGEDTSFSVQVNNQGENDETDVPVKITIGKGNEAIEIEENIDEIAKGQSETVEVPLSDQPPTGQSVPVTVDVGAVPGEDKTDNNKQTYSAIFTR